MSTPRPVSRPAHLRAEHERLLDLLRERDRLLTEYVAALKCTDQHYAEWSRATWKQFARNQLALIQAVRPLAYVDYRARVQLLSPTYGTLPGPALKAARDHCRRETVLFHEVLGSPGQSRPVEEAELGTELTALFNEEVGLPVAPEALEQAEPGAFTATGPLPESAPLFDEQVLVPMEEYHAQPSFEGLLLSPEAMVKQTSEALLGLFSTDERLLIEQDGHTTLAELYQRKRAALQARAAAAEANAANRRAEIERRAYRRAVLQPGLPDMVNFLASHSTSCHE